MNINHESLVDPKDIEHPFHFKMSLMKNFVTVLNKTSDAFRYLPKSVQV